MDNSEKSVYIETTIPSLITARPSRDIDTFYRQNVTKRFWETERHNYDLYISNYVLSECKRGDPEFAKMRLSLIDGIQILDTNQDIEELAKEYHKLMNIPTAAEIDGFHLAICVIRNVDFLLSWNLKHLGQRSFALMVEYNTKHGLHIPILCDPNTLLSATEED
ncbi:hypothetical protein R80B4_00346 [Fibrobacteres bacterium R8-0-B4]